MYWEGRQLLSIEIYGLDDQEESLLVSTISYTYNDQGYRTSKTILEPGEAAVVTTYDLLGSQVIHESNGTNDIYYTYDSDGSLISFNLDGEDYFCINNLQGDIVALVDENGAEVATYEYDSYGNLLSSTGAVKSPLTYRGYRYDWEIGLYYLNSRYYNPQIGRFLNSDGLLGETGDILSTNMYAYCANNPIMNIDPTGYWVMSIIGFSVSFGAIFGSFLSVSWVFDNQGNQGLLITAGAGGCFPQVSLTWSPFFSWKKTIYDLQGVGFVVGGGADVGISMGLDFFGDGSGIAGFSLNFGIGASLTAGEGHVYGCVTALIPFKKTSQATISIIMNNLRRAIHI